MAFFPPTMLLRGYAFGLSDQFSAPMPPALSPSRSHVTVPAVGLTIWAGSAPGKLCTYKAREAADVRRERKCSAIRAKITLRQSSDCAKILDWVELKISNS